MKKRVLGQYYTKTNPFRLEAFTLWFRQALGDAKKMRIVEPFAGSNEIVSMVGEQFEGCLLEWDCFDIAPGEESRVERVEIVVRDTLKDYPSGYSIAITNPPYLARNSATRRNLKFPDTNYEDLYQYALDLMLRHTDYVAAIVPESFITSGLFRDRLETVISLTEKMFQDTDCPVCLALFSKEEKDRDFKIFDLDRFLGTYSELLAKSELSSERKIKWKFNDPKGKIGLLGADDNKSDSIRFVRGSFIPSDRVKVSSRTLTRISGYSGDIDQLLKVANRIIERYRKETKDVFLTSFKGLRKDGKYRRRMDFKTARAILNTAVLEIEREEMKHWKIKKKSK